jgi:hypothetical protein
MENWLILGAGIGAGLVLSELWRRRSRPGQSDRGRASTDSDENEPEVWVELDVEPLFPSSDLVSPDYLVDLTVSSETESDRGV